jgi:excisionase family DNA binding protein
MTSTQAAEYLGVSYSIIKSMVSRGLVSYTKTPGGHYRFTADALDAYIQHTYKTEWASHERIIK